MCRVVLRTRNLLGWLTFVAVVGLAFWLGAPSAQPGRIFPDTDSYLTLYSARAPTPFLFYSLAGTGRAASLLQTVLSLTAWSGFGWMALGPAGAAFGAALALSMPIALWNTAVLSEPLTLTFGAALCAATLALGRRWTWPRFVVWAACTLLLVAARVEQVVLVAVAGAALLVWYRRHWLALGIVGACAAAIAGVWGVLADQYWQMRLTNVVLTRILQDPELEAYFVAAGLPREEKLLGYRGQMLADCSEQFRADTPAFQHWLATESRATYTAWLRTAMPHRKLVAQMDIVTARPFYDYYLAGAQLAPAALDLLGFYDRVRMPFGHWLWLAAVPVLCAALSLQVRFADVFGVVFIPAVYGMAFISYHADSCELERHMMLVAGLYRMAPLVAFAGVWERLVSLSWGHGARGLGRGVGS